MIKQRSQKGMTLVEVMIALVLASLIILAIISLFLGNSRNYRMEEGLSRIQENARYALDLLNTDAREAGYSGCVSIDKLRVKVVATPPAPEAFTATDQIIQGFEGGVGLPASLLAIPGRDAVTFRGSKSCGAGLTAKMPVGNANIQIQTPNDCDFAVGDVVMISDCEDAHVFRISAIPGGTSLEHSASSNIADSLCRSYPGGMSPGACAAGEEKRYGTESEIRKSRMITYFIRNNIASVPSLFRETPGEGVLELVEGVDDMQILYGIDNDGDRVIDAYQSADLISDWAQVIGVKVGLLMTSIEDNILDGVPVSIAAGTKNIDGLTLVPITADNQLRRPYSNAIGIRNGIP